jgi:pantoate--beta-alanine ligase
MVEAFFMPVSIVACPTVRETDNLAMSSRNLRLSQQERQHAAHFPRLLATDAPVENIARLMKKDGFEVDYVQDFKGRRCAAIHCGGVRLIDNIALPLGDGR